MTPTNHHDEQTETDELGKLMDDIYRCGQTDATLSVDDYTLLKPKMMIALEAWSRQQTAQVLDKVLEQKKEYRSRLRGDDSDYLAVPVAAIEAVRAKLRKGVV